jgi:ectoine hydroxylase-related dioxygenase (phytanoyl-CoA dioxygenase family)
MLSFIHQNEKNNEVSKACYEVFHSLPSVLSLSGHPLVLELVSSAGIVTPTAGSTPVIRLDRPGENFRLTPWHRDYWFSFLSERAVVLWFPLVDLSPDMGLLRVLPGSHKFGVIPIRERSDPEPFEPIEDYDKYPGCLDIELAESEILILSQNLLHKSGINNSKKIRMSVQLRFNDLNDCIAMTSSYGVTISPFTRARQIELLQKS